MDNIAFRIKPLYLALIILGTAVYISGLLPDVFIDAGKYAAVSRGIADSGDLIHVKIMGEPYLQKPPFLFWLAALSIRIFGISNFAFKLPTLLFSLLGFYSTYRLGCLLYDRKTGAIAAILLSFSQAMFLYNNDTHTDTVLTHCIIFSIWQLYSWYLNRKTISYILGFLAAGCALITKGPIGVIIPFVALGGHQLLKKDYKLLFSPKWLPGIILVALVSLPALKGLYDQFGMEGIKFFFWTNNMGRITGEYAGDSTDYSFYIHTFSYIFLPWSILSFVAFFVEVKRLARDKFRMSDKKEFICWCGILFFMVVFSIAKMKSPHYMMPIIPLISIISAKWMVRMAEERDDDRLRNAFINIQRLIEGILIILTGILLFKSFPDSGIIFRIVFILLAIMYLYISYFLRKTILEKILFGSIVAISILNLSINTVLLPELNKYHAAARASEFFNRASPGNARLDSFGYDGFEMGFYAKNQGRQLREKDLDNLLTNGDWIFTTAGGLEIMDRKGIKYTVIKKFSYIKLSNINFNMLFPGSREKEARMTYLIRII